MSRSRTLRQVVTALAWIAALAAVVAAIGLRVAAHRRADPRQILRPYLAWLPEDLPEHAVLVGRTPSRSGLTLELELSGTPAEIRGFAARNQMEDVIGSFIGGGVAGRWQLSVPGHPAAQVHLILPSDGGPALLTVFDDRGTTP